MLFPPQVIQYLVHAFEGNQAGEVLASYLVHKQAELPFLSEFGGIEGFLQRQVTIYEGYQPGCARELEINKAALQEVAKITAALVTLQRPAMDFGSSSPTEPAGPAMDFGGGAGTPGTSGAGTSAAHGAGTSGAHGAGTSGARAGAHSLPPPPPPRTTPAHQPAHQPAGSAGKRVARQLAPQMTTPKPGPYQPKPGSAVAQGLQMPAGRSVAYSLALPPRSGEGIADSAGSRSDIREGMARLANQQRTAAAKHASAHPPPPSSLIRRGGERGEMLGPQHVAEELARVQRRIKTQQLRDESASEGEGEGGGEDEDLGLPFRARGRGADEWDADELPRLDRGWQHAPPKSADGDHRLLRRVKIAAVFPTSARGELRWHYGGFIFDTAVRPLEGGGGLDLWVRAVFPDGFEDWWSALPDPAFAFEGRGQKVASEKVEQARRSCGI